MPRVGIIGAGYVGLVTGACLAELGHTVVCVESDPHRLGMLGRGEMPIHEPGLEELVTAHRRDGRLRFTDDYATAVPDAEFVFIAVNTPSAADGQADTTFVFSAVRSVLEFAHPGLVIVMKSTVPVGTADGVAELVERSGRRNVEVVSNPEFLRQGTAVADLLHPDRIVVGGVDPAAAASVAALYRPIVAPVITCSRRSAELAKYAANALLATRISFMNEVAAIAAAVGADIEDVASVVGADPRIGPSFLRAGLGWGGSCFPKDVRALSATAQIHGQHPQILDAVHEVNTRQRDRAFQQLVSTIAPGVESPTIGVLGLAFKPDTDDLRGAPAIDIIGRLVEEGFDVRAHDPVAMPNARRILPHIHYATDAYDAAEGAHALLLATEWRDYLTLDWRSIGTRMRGDVILDGRNALDPEAVVRAGLRYLSFGRSPRVPVFDEPLRVPVTERAS